MESKRDISPLEIDSGKNPVYDTTIRAPDDQKSGDPGQTISGWRWIAVVLAILSSTFVFALGNTITANIQADIIRNFDAVTKLTWISVGLVMSASATVLLRGKIFFQFNRKWTYIISVAIFEVGSAVCGSSPSMNALIVGRVLCGIGGSGLYIGVMTLLAATTTLHERPMYVASTGLAWGLGMVLGPIVGGGFSKSSVGWRWAFYINLLIAAVCVPVYLFLFPNIDPRKGTGFMNRIREIALVAAFLTSVPFSPESWLFLSVASLGPGTVARSSALYAIFTTAERRILSIEFFKSRTMLVLFASTSAAGTACFVPIYMIPLFFQFMCGEDAFGSAVRLLPFIVLCIFAIIVNGGIMSAFGLYMPWYTIGGALMLIGGAFLYTVNVDTNVAHIYGYSIITGLGTGMYLQASFSVAQASVKPQQFASASSFITCAQVVGTTIALAIANSVFLNKAQENIIHILPNISLQEVLSVISGTSSLVSSLPADKQTALESGIVSAMGHTYILVITAGSLTVLLSLLMKRERLFMQAGAAV
ncbi:efflux pump antibiotic resistance protein, putative [Talaromyces stipitatus ATCC 10500]|uniref:Efflux pump antibiotic resistance protein, putative n=1 Tax=Talaromyces stipitatus (strain ATCC 10500 / CBS 375.48 / QM 6759 / NRRL 1006) TaxID=441959 RepID=B8MU43_TALSN|nr:efflux pump antibiotic resistance protein, putative [Talaromyces stipitatus ATCC 10500]EED12676.1 efflux pump antibiotic resistance protein, putative [Talaromyces stipitatus ATCC 10500]